MRKVGTEADLDRRRKRSGIVISVMMLALLVASSAGFAFLSSNHTSGSEQTSGVQGGYGNSGVGNWVVPVLDQEVRVTYGPEEVAEIPVSLTKGLADYQGKPLYLAVENPGIEAELRSTLGLFAETVELACFGECSGDLPEKDCSENVIVWADAVGGQVNQGEGCVFIEGDLRAVDAFLYRVFGY